jgi:hypothetical protein
MALATLVAAAVSFTACNRVQGTQSVQPVTGVMARRQPSAPAQTAVPTPPSSPPASSTSSSSGGGASKSEAPAPKVVVSDHSQTLIVAQQTFRLLTHVQSIEGTTE